jgi:hypothetical protein
VRASLRWMARASDSSPAARRNIFDAPVPAIAGAEGTEELGRTIFDTPTPSPATLPSESEDALAFARGRLPRSRAVRLAIAGVTSIAAAVLGVVVASHGEPESRTNGPAHPLPVREPTGPAVGMPEPSRSERSRTRHDISTDARPGRQDQRRRPHRGPTRSMRPAPRVAPTPTPPTPAPAAPPAEASPRGPVAPSAPAGRAPAPVPEGAPPQFL